MDVISLTEPHRRAECVERVHRIGPRQGAELRDAKTEVATVRADADARERATIERTAAEAEAHQMLTMLEAAAAKSKSDSAGEGGAVAPEESEDGSTMPTAELTGAAGLVATVLCHLVAVR